jgi:alpha-L-fucosidase
MMTTMELRSLFPSLALLIPLWVFLQSVCWIHSTNTGDINFSGGFFFVQAEAAATAAAPPTASYDATWESLDSRPLPQWYNDAKIGIFIHWGVFSVPAYGDAWFWKRWKDDQSVAYVNYVEATEVRNFAYPDYAHRFDATFYKPKEWAKVFADSGAQYVVFVSKHHEGFCNWDSRNVTTTWNWNAMDVGPRRDLLGELATAIRTTPLAISKYTQAPLKFGVYHSGYEWFNPMYQHDKANHFKTQTFVESKTLAELYHLVDTYQPEILWSDGCWDTTSDYWKAKEFLAWLATNSSVAETVVWNDRWGSDSMCKHGSFLTCSDRYEPQTTLTAKWEKCMTLDKHSWGFDRNSSATDYYTTTELVHLVISTISKNGNILINVGPAADGTISPIMIDRLLDLGKWLTVNGKAVYGTQPWSVCSNDTATTPGVFYTRSKDTLYAHLTKWPKGNQFELSCPLGTKDSKAYMLGIQNHTSVDAMNDYAVQLWSLENSCSKNHNNICNNNTGLRLRLPALSPADIPCQHAWVIAIIGIGNLNGAGPAKDTLEPTKVDE